ncbi:hypothetical protein CL653_03315 [bacterium]|nr:hypothetical protein [bacterium]
MSFGKKLKKNILKVQSSTIHHGFPDPRKVKWVSVGNYAMNKLISGRYTKSFPYGKSIIVGGESGSGKSLVFATTAKCAQDDGAFVFWIDTENASDQDSYDPTKDFKKTQGKWFKNLGLKVEEDDDFHYTQAATIQDVKSIIANIVDSVSSETDEDNVQPVVVVVDSWTNLMTGKQEKEASSGKVVGDVGQFAKQLKDTIKQCTHLVTRRPILLLGVVHSYESQDMFKPGEQLSGGRGLVYMASAAFLFQKYKLKAGEAKKEDNSFVKLDTKKVVGTKAVVQLFKSRFAKPNERVTVEMVWPNGLDMSSGLFDLLEEEELIESVSGQSYKINWPEGVAPPKDFPEQFTRKAFKPLAKTIAETLDQVTVPDLMENTEAA